MQMLVSLLVGLWLIGAGCFVANDPEAGAALAFTLTWDANTETDLAGYKLYRKAEECAGASGLQYVRDVGNVTTTQDEVVVTANTWFCWGITAVNTSGQESEKSNLVQAMAEVPPIATPTEPTPPPCTIQCVKTNPKGKCVKYQCL